MAMAHLSGGLADSLSCLFLGLLSCFLGLLLHILSSDTHRQASWAERGGGRVDGPAIEACLVCLHLSHALHWHVISQAGQR